jgi:hypothetical protein
LLLAQAQFEQTPAATGKVETTPGAARLTIARYGAGRWTAEVLEDPESNVFHKAMPFLVTGEPRGILTIGANFAPIPARMKLWRRMPDGWQGTTIASADFGSRFNRFRDIEVGDVTGDGEPEIVVATHDQGVVSVFRKGHAHQWTATTIDHAANTFVHEIEIADVTGDGVAEIFATPTAPNRVERRVQPGRIMMYTFDGAGWVPSPVAEFADRHAKEILAADLEGAGQVDLFAAIEPPPPGAETPGQRGPGVTINRYRWDRGTWLTAEVATIAAESCRFLRAGDVDGDHRRELVASCGRTGLWLLRPGAERWPTERIDHASTAVELATALADLDRDGVAEIYVAAEDQGQLRAYVWEADGFHRYELMEIPRDVMNFGLEVVVDPECLR